MCLKSFLIIWKSIYFYKKLLLVFVVAFLVWVWAYASPVEVGPNQRVVFVDTLLKWQSQLASLQKQLGNSEASNKEIRQQLIKQIEQLQIQIKQLQDYINSWQISKDQKDKQIQILDDSFKNYKTNSEKSLKEMTTNIILYTISGIIISAIIIEGYHWIRDGKP